MPYKRTDATTILSHEATKAHGVIPRHSVMGRSIMLTPSPAFYARLRLSWNPWMKGASSMVYKKTDAEKLENLVKIVGKTKVKLALTLPEMLTALRYTAKSKEIWEDALIDAEEANLRYQAYRDGEDEEAMALQGLEWAK